MAKVKRVLISVSNKMGIATFAKELSKLGVEILSTGGTASLLKKEDIPVKEVSEYTGSPEILGGRVKTLHPKIHGGILGIRDKKEHLQDMKKHEIEPIDMVVVNLYPFERTIAKPGVSLAEAIENIDIGGPTMIRSAAKNYEYVAVVSSPEDYPSLIEELKEKNGELSLDTRKRLATKAFHHTSIYDTAISRYLSSAFEIRKEIFPYVLAKRWEKMQDLRYGENPHQQAAFYSETSERGFEQLQGKELSFNNILDLEGAWSAVSDFKDTASVVIKHTNPCGLACAENLPEAYNKAKATDPVSAFGSVVGFNRRVGKEVAEEITKTFVEAVIASDYTEEALQVFKPKKDLRVIKIVAPTPENQMEIKTALTGYLLQNKDSLQVERDGMKVATKKTPTEEQWQDLLFSFKVAKNVKSNAIVLGKDKATVGIGAGQMSRVDAMKLAASKVNVSTQGTVLASDAFFPFKDVVEEAHKVGVEAIIQPGGSKNDAESIQACDKYGIAMVFTGERHFKH